MKTAIHTPQKWEVQVESIVFHVCTINGHSHVEKCTISWGIWGLGFGGSCRLPWILSMTQHWSWTSQSILPDQAVPLLEITALVFDSVNPKSVGITKTVHLNKIRIWKYPIIRHYPQIGEQCSWAKRSWVCQNFELLICDHPGAASWKASRVIPAFLTFLPKQIWIQCLWTQVTSREFQAAFYFHCWTVQAAELFLLLEFS